MKSHVAGTVGVSAVGPAVLARSDLSRIDYADHFTLSPVAPAQATAEEWARALFGDVPSPSERFIWQVLLGLRLHPGPSDSTVAGWRIAHRGEDWVRLAAQSRAMQVELVVRVMSESVSLTTLVRYDRLTGRVRWTPLSAIHRRLAPGLLREAEAKVGA